MMELNKFRDILQNNCFLIPTFPVLVGVSGGPDSLCLLDLLDLLGFHVIVAHVDHGLRMESSLDEGFVEAFCVERGLAFTSTHLDVAEYSRQAHLSIEEAARIARYKFLFEQAELFRAQAVAVAHTADDQVETVLMHLLRGAGLSGLKGMSYLTPGREWGSSLPLVRPLLSTWRAEVLEQCQARGLQPRHDPTNLDPIYFRNRLRLELIPTLETYNSRIKSVLWRTAQTLAGDQKVVEEAIIQANQTCDQKIRANFVSFVYPEFIQLPEGQQRNLLRGSIANLLPNLRDVDFNSIERALAFVRTPSQHCQIDLVKGLYLFVEDNRLFVAQRGAQILDDEWPWMETSVCESLLAPGKVMLGGGWSLQADRRDEINFTEMKRLSGDPFQCWLDGTSFSPPLSVRTSQPGERFQPLGMDGHSLRLSDFWVNKKLSRRARNTWPLVWADGLVAWIPMYQLGHPFRLTATTTSVIHLRLVPPEYGKTSPSLLKP